MALTINPTYNHPIQSTSGMRNAFINQAPVAIALVADDKVRLAKVPAGTKVDEVVIYTAGDLDTGTPALQASIGFEHCDGSTGGDDDIVAAAGVNALSTANATTTYHVFPPVVLAKDSWLIITCTTGSNAQASAAIVHGKVLGECQGAA